MRLDSLKRQWLLLRLLASRKHGIAIDEIAQLFEVSEKTVRRDLEALESVEFPLSAINGPHGKRRWQVDVKAPEFQINFDTCEIAALYLARRFLEPLAGTLFWDSIQSSFQKIQTGLGEAAIEHLEMLARCFHHTSIGASDYAATGDLIDQLMVCIEDSCKVNLLYRSMQADDYQPTTVDPLGMIYHRGALYLVAYSSDREELRMEGRCRRLWGLVLSSF
jgi:predicted DNA-binding transcriptional regulator YafY